MVKKKKKSRKSLKTRCHTSPQSDGPYKDKDLQKAPKKIIKSKRKCEVIF